MQCSATTVIYFLSFIPVPLKKNVSLEAKKIICSSVTFILKKCIKCIQNTHTNQLKQKYSCWNISTKLAFILKVRSHAVQRSRPALPYMSSYVITFHVLVSSLLLRSEV